MYISMHMYIFCKKRCNLDAIIYNKIRSIVNVIRLKLFILINIVYKYGTIDNVYYIYIIPEWKSMVIIIIIILRVYLWNRDLVISLALECT